MILYYIIFILIPIITNAGDELGPSYRSSVMEGGKPILRGGGPEEVEENDMTELPQHKATASAVSRDPDTTRDLKFLIAWLMNNYGYEIVANARRQDTVVNSTATESPESLMRSHHSKRKHTKKTKAHKSKHERKKAIRVSHKKHSKKKSDTKKTSHSKNKTGLRNSNKQELEIGDLNNQDFFDFHFNEPNPDKDKSDKQTNYVPVIKHPYFTSSNIKTPELNEENINLANFNDAALEANYNDDSNLGLNTNNNNRDNNGNFNYDDFTNINTNVNNDNVDSKRINDNFYINQYGHNSDPYPQNIRNENENENGGAESPSALSNIKDFVYGIVHDEIPKLGNDILRLGPEGQSMKKAPNLTVALYVNVK